MTGSDIKADNILLSRDNTVRISDFGISYLSSSSNQDAQLTSDFGSPYWMAPEVIEMRQPPTPKSDIWSVGCLTLEIFTGRPPYFNLTPMSALYHICSDAAIPIEDPNHTITQACRLFLQKCFQKDPERRPSAEQLLTDPWFEQPQPRERTLFEAGPGFTSPQSTVRKPHGVGSDGTSFGGMLERRSSSGGGLERKSSLGSLMERNGRNVLVEKGGPLESRGSLVLKAASLSEAAASVNPSMKPSQSTNPLHSTTNLSQSMNPLHSTTNLHPPHPLSTSSSTNLDDQSLRDVEEVFENIDFDRMADELSEKSNSQDMDESKLLSSIQVVIEASRRHSQVGDLPTALRTLRQAIMERGQADAVVRNGGLYPLVSCALVKVNDEETSLLTLQVGSERQ